MKRNSVLVQFVFVCVFLFAGKNSFSQKNYLPGYIVKNDKEKVDGFIDYRNWGKNPEKIAFKLSENSEEFFYEATDIRSFFVKDEKYVSAIVETEISTRALADLKEEKGFSIDVDTVFLQTLIEGPKSLYYLKNKKGIDNFYIKEGDQYSLLLYKPYLREDKETERAVFVENKKFIGQLTLYLSSCNSINNKVRNAKYKKNSLQKLFNKYYDCTEESTDFKKKEDKASFSFGVLAGVSNTSVELESDSYEEVDGVNYNSSVGFTAGLSFELTLPRNLKKVSLVNDVLYTSYSIEGEKYSKYYSETFYTKMSSKFDYSYLKLNSMLRYRHPFNERFSGFINAGVSFAMVVDGSNSVEIEFVNTNNSRIENREILDAKKFEQGVVVGVGTAYKRFSFEARYENSNGISDLKTLSSNTNRYYFLLGYKF